MTVSIAVERADQPEVLALLAEAAAYSRARYPAESDHRLPVEALLGPGVTFFVLRRDGEALGTAALYRAPDGSAELKSMGVAERARRCGCARRRVRQHPFGNGRQERRGAAPLCPLWLFAARALRGVSRRTPKRVHGAGSGVGFR